MMKLEKNAEVFACFPELFDVQGLNLIMENVQNPVYPLPKITITEQPGNRFRFRYKTEEGAHGSIMGRNNKPRAKNKSHPKIMVENYIGKIKICIDLYADLPADVAPIRHVHELKGPNCPNGQYEIVTTVDTNPQTFEISGVYIGHTAKKDVPEVLSKRLKEELLANKQTLSELGLEIAGISETESKELEEKAKKKAKEMEMYKNAVKFGIKAYGINDVGSTSELCGIVFSEAIHNEKSPTMNKLKICHMSIHSGFAKGGDEMIILCEKVEKNIKVRFFEEGEILWEAFGLFSEVDIHKQYAIILRTPQYKTEDIDKDVTVKVELVRPTDGEKSEPLDFVYRPTEYEEIQRKRKKTIDCRKMGEDEQLFYGSKTFGNHSVYDNEQMDMNAPSTSTSTHALSFSPGVLEQQQTSTSSNNVEISVGAIDPELGSSELDFDISDLLKEYSGFKYLLSNIDPLDPAGFDILADGPGVTKPSKLIDRGGIPTLGIHQDRKFAQCQEKREMIIDKTICDKNISGFQIVYQLAVKTAEALQSYAKSSDIIILLKTMAHLIAIPDENGDNAIHVAVIHAKLESDALFKLVEVATRTSECDPLNMFNNLMQTPLHIAVHINFPKIVEALIRHGANPNHLDRYGNSALHLASKHGKDKIVEVILNMNNYSEKFMDNKPLLEQINYDGYTPLQLAVQSGSVACVKKLCEVGADINVEGKTSGKTSIHLAVENNNIAVLKELLKHRMADVNGQTFSGYTPLHIACSSGATEMVRLLMEADADPTIGVSDGPEYSDDEGTETKEDGSEGDDVNVSIYNSYDMARDNQEILQLLYRKDAAQEVTSTATQDKVHYPPGSTVSTMMNDPNVNLETQDSSLWSTSAKKKTPYQDSGLGFSSKIDANAEYDTQEISDDDLVREDCKKFSEFGFGYFPKMEEHLFSSASIPEQEKTSFQDSGLGITAKNDEVELMDNATKTKLSSLLDPSGEKDWKHLANLLDLEYLCSMLETAPSPTKALLPYIESINHLHHGLDALGFQEAVQVVEKYRRDQVPCDASSQQQTNIDRRFLQRLQNLNINP